MELKNKLKKLIPSKHLILIKLLLFTYFGATHSLVPYLAVHMKQLGISVHETAIIHAILPVAMFIGPPISGFVADKFGGFKILLFVALLMNGALHTGLLWVPQVRPGASLETANASCSSNGENVYVSFLSSSPDCSLMKRTIIEFSDCSSHCPDSLGYGIENSQQDTVLCGFPTQDGQDTCISFNNSTGHYIIIIDDKLVNNSIEEQGKTLVIPSTLSNSSSSCHSWTNKNCTLVCAKPSGVAKLWAPECGDRQTTFWVYLIIRIAASIFMSSCYVLLDSITLHVIEHHDTDYGKQRMAPVLATAVFPPITGFMVDYLSSNADVPNYAPTFYVQDVLLVITAVMSTLLTVKIKLTSETNIKTVFRLMKTPRADWLFVALFVLGTMWGFVEVFLYWYLLDLNSPKYLLGLTLTVGSGVGIPVLFFAEKIINKIGHVNIIFTAFLFYSIRYIGYSFIYNPWWCLVFEAMEIFTLHVLWVAVVKYSTMLAPKSLLATMQGAIGGTHYGVGRGSGSLIGGLLMEYLGARETFRYMGISAISAGVIYVAVERIFFRTPLQPQETNSEKPKNDETDRKVAPEDKEAGTVVSNDAVITQKTTKT